MKDEKTTPDQNYTLQSEAVEALVNAEAGEVPQYSQEELKKYRKKRFSLPPVVKVLLLRFWFAGAVCYFVLWGLGLYLGNGLDMLFALGIVLGMVTDLLTNNLIRYFETVPGEHEPWLLVRKKGALGLVLNLIWSTVIVVCVFFLYQFINVVLLGQTTGAFLGVEPIAYGLFCMGFDMLFVGMKRLWLAILRDAKAQAAQPKG